MRALIIEDDAVSARLIESALEADNMVFERSDNGEAHEPSPRLSFLEAAVRKARLPGHPSGTFNLNLSSPAPRLAETPHKREGPCRR